MSFKKILFAVSFEKGRGTGHLVRSAENARRLREAGLNTHIFLCTNGRLALREAQEIAGGGNFITDVDAALKQDWDLVIFDRFKTPQKEAVSFFERFPVIALDEGGPFRSRFDFLFDLIPSPRPFQAPNVTRPAWLFFPENRRPDFPDFCGGEVERSAKDAREMKQARILIAFGGEDPALLGGRAAKILADAFPAAAVYLLGGRFAENGAGGAPAPKNAVLLKPQNGLRERLHSYDVVITHFGLTAFEAVYARCAVVLLSPSRLHQKLGLWSGFLTLGGRAGGLAKLERICKKKSFFKDAALCAKAAAERFNLEKKNEGAFFEYINKIDAHVFRTCPVCGKNAGIKRKVLARFENQTFIRCPHCRMIFQQRLCAPPVEYNEAYFFENYKKQYGKTYMEDFPDLINISKKRLAVIKKILLNKNGVLPPAPLRLLDAGCAYGAFLLAAKNDGFSVCGVDQSADAVDYTRRSLCAEAYALSFPQNLNEKDFPPHSFNCVTMWFVIEHLRDVPAALKKARLLLKDGGVFAFSTPSACGVSAKKSLLTFLKNSPQDHWTVWLPYRTPLVLKSFGFAVKKIRITGRHPERFPFLGKYAKKGGFLYALLYAASGVFRLGDTFEVYARAVSR
ncbi:MAG: class I SAM-dependent methyltransferase [Spirochaetaceae bacterium]|jgi:2-polyprenyl-3-methyl-5-hydroxy-6-metoxy-1,4-benzoquinol methylase|nr:class I SAM-dependent methyltransferase [Spirochaetaceae bacterium]